MACRRMLWNSMACYSRMQHFVYVSIFVSVFILVRGQHRDIEVPVVDYLTLSDIRK